MKMEPPQLFADWYDDTTVLGGYVEENETLLHIKAFKVRLCPLPAEFLM